MKKRSVALVLSAALCFGAAVGGTFAWLTDKTDAVVNTFTYGDINIDLAEKTGTSYTIIPGLDITKDPEVSVEAGSEACWLFVTVTEQDWSEKVKYEIAEGWTNLEAGVYYREVSANDAKNGVNYDVLKGDKVTVLNTDPGG